jgi:hypothetical protein
MSINIPKPRPFLLHPEDEWAIPMRDTINELIRDTPGIYLQPRLISKIHFQDNTERLLSLYVNIDSSPTHHIDPISFGNMRMPGRHRWDDIDIEIIDFVNQSYTLDSIIEIFNNEMGNLQKKTFVIDRYNHTGEHIESWSIEGFISSFNYGLDGDGGAKITFTITIDYAILNF